MKLTSVLEEFISQRPKERSTLEAMVEERKFQLDGLIASTAESVYTAMDATIESVSLDKISCRKGCSACCHQLVGVTRSEAKLLAMRVRDGVSIDRKRLKRLAQYLGSREAYMNEHSACVFLKDGVCQVYDSRPVACRKHFVLSDPKECVNPKGEVDKFGIINAEIFASSFYLAEGGMDPLPHALQRELER